MTAVNAFSDVAFTHAFTSPLERARETAQIVLRGKQVKLVEDSRLSEFSFGKYEGLALKDSLRNYPEIQNFFYAPEKYRPAQGAESIQSVITRTGDFLKELAGRAELADAVILLSTHGAASRAVLANIRKTGPKDFWGKGVPKNCSVTKITWNAAEGYAIEWQDRAFYE